MKLGISPLSMLFCIGRIGFACIPKKKCKVMNNNVLILIGGNLGDFLIGANAYTSLMKHYVAHGKKVYFCCPHRVRSYMQLFSDFNEADVIEFNGCWDNATRIKGMFCNLGVIEFDKIVIFGSSVTWESLLLVSILRHNESWIVVHERKRNNISEFLKDLFSVCYTNKIVIPLDMQQQQRDKMLLKRLGVQKYCVRIYPIPKVETYVVDCRYITVAVDSSASYRRWPVSNFIEMIKRLRETYQCDLYITGSNVSIETIRKYENAFESDQNVKIIIGQTGLTQWIELIRGSWFHIGVDSGSIHVAASVGTKCFCLCGVWAGHRIMPYVIDQKALGTAEPICIYRRDIDPESLTCYGCNELNLHGMGNAECRTARSSGNPCQCLEKITVKQVLDVIQKEI